MSAARERITQLLAELNSALEQATAAGDTAQVSAWFYVPAGPGTVMFCQFRTERIAQGDIAAADLAPRIRFTDQNELRPGFAARRASAQARAAAT